LQGYGSKSDLHSSESSSSAVFAAASSSAAVPPVNTGYKTISHIIASIPNSPAYFVAFRSIMASTICPDSYPVVGTHDVELLDSLLETLTRDQIILLDIIGSTICPYPSSRNTRLYFLIFGHDSNRDESLLLQQMSECWSCQRGTPFSEVFNGLTVSAQPAVSNLDTKISKSHFRTVIESYTRRINATTHFSKDCKCPDYNPDRFLHAFSNAGTAAFYVTFCYLKHFKQDYDKRMAKFLQSQFLRLHSLDQKLLGIAAWCFDTTPNPPFTRFSTEFLNFLPGSFSRQPDDTVLEVFKEMLRNDEKFGITQAQDIDQLRAHWLLLMVFIQVLH